MHTWKIHTCKSDLYILVLFWHPSSSQISHVWQVDFTTLSILIFLLLSPLLLCLEVQAGMIGWGLYVYVHCSNITTPYEDLSTLPVPRLPGLICRGCLNPSTPIPSSCCYSCPGWGASEWSVPPLLTHGSWRQPVPGSQLHSVTLPRRMPVGVFLSWGMVGTADATLWERIMRRMWSRQSRQD